MKRLFFYSKCALLTALLTAAAGAWAQEQTGGDQNAEIAKVYDLTVDGVTVTDLNRHDVFATTEQLGYATVIFDGDSTLILQGAQLDSIATGLGKGLRIHLIGGSSLVCYDGNAIRSHEPDVYRTLTFTTDGNRPGWLNLDMYESPWDYYFDVEFKDGLDIVQYYPSYEYDPEDPDSPGEITEGDITYYIEARIPPMLDNDETGAPTTEEVTFSDDDFLDYWGEEVDLSDTVIDGILYTMSDRTMDGYENGYIVFGTQMTEEQVAEAMQYTPGTYSFAYAFTGATFMVPAGTGVIKLTVQVDEDGIMMVKVGNREPVAISGTEGDVTIPYVCAEPTYVYVYNGTPIIEEVSEARMGDRFREKKATIVVRMSAVSVTPDTVQEMAEPGTDPIVDKLLSSFSITGNIVRIDDTEITSLADGLFKGVKARYFDLSKTSITGMNVSRSRGAFEDVPEDAFIYVPVGNTADEGEPNVVIGEVCEDMQLPGDSDDPDMGFEAAMDFSANVTLDRDLTVGQTATIYLPFAVGKDEAAAIGSFFTFNGINSMGDAELVEAQDGLAANTPYIFRKTADAQAVQFANVRVLQLPEEPVTAEMIGTFEYHEFTAEEANNYLYGYAAKDDNEAGVVAGEFVRIAAGAFIKPFRAYLKLEGDAGSRINIKWGDEEGEVTGISEVAPLNENEKMRNDKLGGVYDLQGRRVQTSNFVGGDLQSPTSKLGKGIYIVNGKLKVVQ